ncbi:hypothetical protein AB0758_44995 [Tolypothrix bouteillei VB521301_2]
MPTVDTVERGKSVVTSNISSPKFQLNSSIERGLHLNKHVQTAG